MRFRDFLWATLVGGGVLAIQLLNGPEGAMARLHQPGRLVVLALAWLVLVGLAWLSLWSWERLRPMWRDEAGKWHIDMAVMSFGVAFAVSMAVRQAASASHEVGFHQLEDSTFWSALVLSLLITVPAGLWAGRLFGGAMSRTLGRRPE